MLQGVYKMSGYKHVCFLRKAQAVYYQECRKKIKKVTKIRVDSLKMKKHDFYENRVGHGPRASGVLATSLQ